MNTTQPCWTRLVRVFGGHGAAGNRAQVQYYSSPPPALPATDGTVICQLFPNENSRTLQLRFFGAGGPIRRCGHGALAAAHALAAQHGRLAQRFCFDIGGETWRATRRGGNCLLLLPSVSLQDDAVAADVADVLGSPTVRVQCTADPMGYRIVALPAAAQLHALDAMRIAARPLDNRAWIVSAPSNRDDCDVELRYFAPQYGVQEDSGTGSIGAVVEQFWSAHRPRRQLRVFQCSTAGAYWRANPRGNWVGLIGRTETIDV